MTPPLQTGDIIELDVERLASGGAGVGKHQNFVVFVFFAAPDERVRARVTKVYPRYAEANLVAVVNASPYRVLPPCSVFGRCGGCTWQHVAYAEQLKQKQNIVEKSLRGLSCGQILRIEPSPKELHYRNRIQLKMHDSQVGYFARNSHQLVAIDHCWLAEEVLQEEITQLQVEAERRPSSEIKRVEILRTEDDEVKVNYGGHAGAVFGFAQVNQMQNENLLQYAQQCFHDVQIDELWDLYSGAGNFGLPLSLALPQVQVRGCDLSRAAIERAQKKSQQYGVAHRVQYKAQDVSHWLKQSSTPNLSEKRIGVVLDPPREGCQKSVLEELQKYEFERVLYVSCNVATLARDLKVLTQKQKLEILKVKPFDMFPQTDHIEVAVVLGKK